ncbi:hypothetical protein HJ526_12140 [Donghicola sp. C2-DW-16]|uniref:Uncharacterized protein n=1 Tax=Donghicola mangrovi TaxID=2729614 RepID=A0ABX2PG54_9RHOB|nr:hypothetical protein [Donghicola mangrovi]NVO28175.1 hypothetical protein [Donghicola mangrovi]
MPARTLFVIRTNAFDLNSRLLGQRLAEVAGATVVYVADERKGIVDTAGYAKIVTSEGALAGLGIRDLPADWGWFCGDMCYYLAADRYPDFEQYALVESDVYIPERSVKSFVEQLRAKDVDATAFGLGPLEKTKPYSKDLKKLDLDHRWGCIFPITCVTKDLVHVMHALRIRALKRDLRINDEGILCGAVQLAKASYKPLEQLIPDLIDPDTFDTNPPHLLDALYADPEEARIFHPAVSFEKVIDRIYSSEKNYTRHRLRRVLKEAEGMQRTAILRTLGLDGEI